MLLQLSKTVKQSPKSPQIFENNGTFCADRPFSKNRSETNCQKSFVFNQLVSELQSYILSTTTETWPRRRCTKTRIRLQSYILSTTTETLRGVLFCLFRGGFNRTSFKQKLKQKELISSSDVFLASIVHPFNNNWNFTPLILNRQPQNRFNRTSFQQQLKHFLQSRRSCNNSASIVHPFNNNWNISAKEISDNRFASIVHPFNNNWNPCCFNQPAATPSLQSYILSTTTETVTFPWVQAARIRASIVHPFNNNWNSRWWKH